jgi:hypothetical protein
MRPIATRFSILAGRKLAGQVAALHPGARLSWRQITG